MTIRTFSDKTQRDYIGHVEAFASFLGRSPDTATGDEAMGEAVKAIGACHSIRYSARPLSPK
jgi:hypothetical protein